MSSVRKISGFTLIELIVVISIVASLFLFSLPVFKNLPLFSDAAGEVGDIVRLINDLKKRAVEKNFDFLLHIDTGAAILWVTDDTMDDTAKQTAKEKSVRLSENLIVTDIEFINPSETRIHEYQIRFRKRGYCDFALIHITENDNNITLKIEPFLSRVQVLHKHVTFDDCN